MFHRHQTSDNECCQKNVATNAIKTMPTIMKTKLGTIEGVYLKLCQMDQTFLIGKRKVQRIIKPINILL